MVESVLAVLRAGAIGVPLNPRSSDAELAHFLQDSGASVVVTDSAQLARLHRLAAPGEARPRVLLTGTGPVPADTPEGTVLFRTVAEGDGTPAGPMAPAPRDDLGSSATNSRRPGSRSGCRSVPSTQRLLPSISLANAAQGESGCPLAAAEGALTAAAVVAVPALFALSVFDEQPVIRAAAATSPPVTRALR